VGRVSKHAAASSNPPQTQTKPNRQQQPSGSRTRAWALRPAPPTTSLQTAPSGAPLRALCCWRTRCALRLGWRCGRGPGWWLGACLRLARGRARCAVLWRTLSGTPGRWGCAPARCCWLCWGLGRWCRRSSAGGGELQRGAEAAAGGVSDGGGSGGGGRVAVAAAAAAWRRKLAVVQLSAVAAVLAALACINWALAFFAAAAAAPLAVACSSNSGTSRGSKVVAAAVWLLLSPPALLAAAYNVSGHSPQQLLQADQLRWLVFESSGAAYAVGWGLYLPLWIIQGYTVWR